jgi:agmatine deiminase
MKTFFVCILLVLSCLPHPVCAAEPAVPWPGLPAWEEEWEKLIPGKADEWDDFRKEHPEWFSVTAPPVVAVRPFAEYEPTQAVLLRPSGDISGFHKKIIAGIFGHVDRIVVFHSAGQAGKMEDQLSSWDLFDGSIELVDVEITNANWTRDYGPLSAVTMDGRVGLIDMRYYHGRAYDDAIPSRLAQHWGINVFRPSMSYEGGNFMADPHGTCYATEKIYNQNAAHSKAEIQAWMKQYLGCAKLVTLKLPKGLGTGHIDMFCKLMNDTTVILGYYADGVQEENGKILDDNEEILEATLNEAGEALTVHRLPLPWDTSGTWFTYTNSLVVNDVVLVPVYADFPDLEEEALQVYAQARPDLEIVTINSDSIIPAGGAIHCVTMTVPEGKLEKFQDDPVQLCELNELNKCEGWEAPCADIPFEGVCEEGQLKFCGADGYPHGQTCEACCGWNPAGMEGQGWYECLPAGQCGQCLDECATANEAACSQYMTHTWTCGQADADPCLERTYAACPPGLACDPESVQCSKEASPCIDGVCPETCGNVTAEGMCDGDLLLWCEGGKLLTEDCVKKGKVCGAVPSLGGDLGCWEGCLNGCPVQGARVCTSDSLSVQTCRGDEWGCLDLTAPEPCPDGTLCFDGICSTPGAEAGPTTDSGTADVAGEAAATAESDAGESGEGSCDCRTAGRPAAALPGPLLALAVLLLLFRFPTRGRLSVTIDHRPSTIDHRPSTIDHRPSTITNDRRASRSSLPPKMLLRPPNDIGINI